MIRNIRGMILAARGMNDRVQAGRPHNSRDRRGGLRSGECECPRSAIVTYGLRLRQLPGPVFLQLTRLAAPPISKLVMSI